MSASSSCEFYKVLENRLAVEGTRWFPAEMVDQPRLYRYIEHLGENVPKFVVTERSINVLTQDGSAMSRIAELASKMSDAGFLNLPFPEVVVQRQVAVKGGGTATMFFHYAQDQEDMRKFRALLIRNVGDDSEFGIIPLLLNMEMSVGEPIMQLSSGNPAWWRTPYSDEHGWHEQYASWGTDTNNSKALTLKTLVYLILLLSTRGIQKTAVEADKPRLPSRLDRLVKGRRKAQERRTVRQHTHTLVDLDPRIAHLDGKTRVDGCGRRSPRLHFRIGHAHTYRIGPGRKDVDVKWVNSYLVGYDAYGEVTHDYKL